MAIFETNYYSPALMRTVSVNVILPSDKTDADGNFISKPPYRTLYLLHGIFGNYTDWIVGTRIVRWAMDYDLAVVMPSGDNNFYVNHAGGGTNYETFIAKELVDFTRTVFPLSTRREDTFIGGLSMGGFGALINGFKYPQTFAGIAALSAAVPTDQEHPADNSHPNPFFTRAYMEECLGIAIDDLQDSDRDIRRYVKADLEQDLPRPRIFMACGTEDFLFDIDKSLAAELADLGYDVTWEEYEGGHDWDFWDKTILDVIHWIDPRKEQLQGISSGNIGR